MPGCSSTCIARPALEAFSARECAAHDRRDDLWLIIDACVYDLTEYVDGHPGGDAILKFAGRDSSEGFWGPQHPASAKDNLRTYLIGRLMSDAEEAAARAAEAEAAAAAAAGALKRE